MRGYLVVAMAVLGLSVLSGQGAGDKPLPAAVATATAAYGDDLHAAKEDFAKKVEVANKKYLESLNAAMATATKAGDLPTANHIQELKESAAEDLVIDQEAPRNLGAHVYLSDMEEMDNSAATWGLGKKGRIGEYKIIVEKNYSPNGLGMHPVGKGSDSHASFRLNGQFKQFHAGVAINDSSNGAASPLIFKVYGDDVLLWKSGPIKKHGETAVCSVSVAGVRVIKLVVECQGDIRGAHAVWLEPVVTR